MAIYKTALSSVANALSACTGGAPVVYGNPSLGRPGISLPINALSLGEVDVPNVGRLGQPRASYNLRFDAVVICGDYLTLLGYLEGLIGYLDTNPTVRAIDLETVGGDNERVITVKLSRPESVIREPNDLGIQELEHAARIVILATIYI